MANRGKDYNKPHAEDHKESMKGGFEGHVIMDSEASGVKSAKEKQKAGMVRKQDYSMGVGEPHDMGKLAHHNAHNPSVYKAEDSVPEAAEQKE